MILGGWRGLWRCELTLGDVAISSQEALLVSAYDPAPCGSEGLDEGPSCCISGAISNDRPPRREVVVELRAERLPVRLPDDEEERRRATLVQGLGSQLEPLDRLDLRGWGPGRDGSYRVRSVAIELGAEGWQSRIELGSDGEALGALGRARGEEEEP